MAKIDDRLVRSLVPPASGNRITYDSDGVKGFGVRVTAAGAKSFVLNFRVKGGTERRHTIGSYPDWNVAAAREEAKRLKREVDRGHDPVTERRADREAPTVGDLCDRYIAEHLPRKRPSSQRNDQFMIENIIRPAWRTRKVTSIEFGDVDRMHRKISEHARIRANRVVALLSKMFSLAMKWKMRADNPAKGIERNDEHRRQRYLSGDELPRLIDALPGLTNQASANAIRLLLLTGARRGELLSMRWQDLDLAAGKWVKPSAHTKQRREHHVPLSAPARQLLAAMNEAAGGPEQGPVFPGTGKSGTLTEIKCAWRSACETAQIDGLRLHDLRHSFASFLVSGGASLPLIGALLGHTRADTTLRYAHLADDPQRAAADRVGAIIAAAGTGPSGPKKEGGGVIPLRKRTA